MIEASRYNFEQLMHMMETELPLLEVIDSLLVQHERSKQADKRLFLNSKLYGPLKAELQEIGELRLAPNGSILWDGYTIIPTYFSEAAAIFLPHVSFVFFVDGLTGKLTGV